MKNKIDALVETLTKFFKAVVKILTRALLAGIANSFTNKAFSEVEVRYLSFFKVKIIQVRT